MEKLEEVLQNRDWQRLRELMSSKLTNRRTIRSLVNRIYIKDGLIFWRAVEALGVAAALAEAQTKDSSVELVRRYFWSLNDESGGNAWNASEAIGSIMAHNPKECGHFNWMYADLLEDESLQEGVLWGLLNLAINDPAVVDPLAEKISPFLTAQNASLRGLAAWIYSLMNNCSSAKGSWAIPENLRKSLAKDNNTVEIYLDGNLYHFLVSELLNKEVLAYDSCEYGRGDLTWSITVASSQKGVCWVGLENTEKEETAIRAWAKKRAPNALLLHRALPNEETMLQLKEYFEGSRQEFTVPLDLRGTPFQIKVWEELRRIPYGETRSYGEIAEKVGNPKGPRAVGSANNKNPIGIITPCHRVVGKKGDLVGYASGLDHKKWLLSLEAAHRQV